MECNRHPLVTRGLPSPMIRWEAHSDEFPTSQAATGSCSSCLRYALAWRERVLAGLEAPRQLRLGMAV